MLEIVQDYYGKKLQDSQDLQTDACCDFETTPEWLKPLLARIHPEILSRYYGCGLVCPALLSGCRILDLGCGSGRDVYALAQLAGAQGSVLGVDMTPEQLAIATQHQGFHSAQFGFNNVTFKEGYIEKLDTLGIPDNSMDVVVSNCVINLSPDKDAVLREIFRVLKPGGEFYFSDVYADRRLPPALRTDSLLYGECLGGALYWNDFLRLALRCGFADPRLVTDRPLGIKNSAIAARIGTTRFYSATYRLFKIADLETACEDYGQAVIYVGSIAEFPHQFSLDKHHHIDTGRVFPVCGNTWRMLKESRFAAHFKFIGDFSRHYGLFPGCGGSLPFAESTATATENCC